MAGGVIACVLVASVAWFTVANREPLRIAAGPRDSFYFEFLKAAQPAIQRRTGRVVEVMETSGAVANHKHLLANEADMALIQGDLFARQKARSDVDDVTLVAPLFPEIVHLIARSDRGIQSIRDLDGRMVYLGMHGSGSRLTAQHLLAYFDVTVQEFVASKGATAFSNVMLKESVDAAIITTGAQNPALTEILGSGEFMLVPITESHGLSFQTSLLRAFDIPAGLYGGAPPVPTTVTPALATTAIVATRRGTSDTAIKQILAAFFDEGLQLQYPVMLARNEVLDWTPMAFHSAAHDYFHPIDQLGWISAVMESLAATKELLFTLGAGLFLLWRRWKVLQEREQRQVLQTQKDHLDKFLVSTLRIEEAQIGCTDEEKLYDYLAEVTRIKLQALREFTEEELRADQAFSIFLTESANLTSKIQAKILAQAGRRMEKS